MKKIDNNKINNVNLMDNYQFNKHIEEFIKLCDEYGYKTYEMGNSIHIDCGKSNWILDYSCKNIKLLHKNIRATNKAEYHIQRKNITNFLNIPKYIKSHDNYRFNKAPKEKTRIEELFEIIEKNNKSNINTLQEIDDFER